MRTRSAPSFHTTASGFTLVEVLVVLTIVGLVLAGTSMSLDALRNRDTDLALARLQRVLEASAEHAQISGRPIAFERLADGYRFSALDADGRWVAYEAPPVFTERMLPAGLRWGDLRHAAGLTDRLVFGQRAPRFELFVHDADGTTVLRGRSTGAVERERRAAAAAT
ncbi:MAG TPA: prepilin-type N-terminal cleavage/methylation domain-containing protein [Rhodocyclaceae bacterium]|nr:prepilin-type N-terminal cleavage/methylation domain-containing protein [Rhodocyclaceae bacterium]